MFDESRITARRVAHEEDRRRVVEIIAEIYQREKRWVNDPETQFLPGDLNRSDLAWFVVTLEDCAAGALRVLYDPPYAQYLSYGLELLDPSLQVEEFIRSNRIAEVGRFAVKPEFRGQFMVAAALMRAATDAVIARGYTHLVTDVFEDDPHTPYRFHTRVMGFCPVATHEIGELHCRSRRITLVLDISSAYARLKRRGHWLYRYMTRQWDEPSHRQLAQRAAQAGDQLADLLHRLQPLLEGRRNEIPGPTDAYSPGWARR
jgi:Acetyltransferase (GNAT) family